MDATNKKSPSRARRSEKKRALRRVAATRTRRARLPDLEAWAEGGIQDCLRFSDEEVLVIEVRVALARAVREYRQKCGLRQADLAQRLGTLQSRVARIEQGRETSVDALIEALAALGATRKNIGRVIAGG